MNCIYLLINLILLGTSLVLTFSKESRATGNWKFILPAALISAALFAACSAVMAQTGLLSFNEVYITGLQIGPLPLEEWLFCLLMPFTTLNIYAYLNVEFPNNSLNKFSLALSNLLLGILVAILFFTYKTGNFYTLGIYVFLFGMLFYVEYVNQLRFMYRFYRLYLLVLLTLFPAYALVTTLPQIYSYFMGLLLLNVYLFELFKSKAKA